MDLYKVLLVDDEEEVYEAIIRKIDWEELGFEVVGYAKNGQEGLEMAEELQPDIVLTDIKMPYMDGFELCRRVHEMYVNTRFIIFTGFDELEFAKETIKIKAEEYILKPVNSLELREVFERLRASMDAERNERRNIEKLRENYLKSLPAMQMQFLGTLLEGNLTLTEIEQQLDICQLNLNSSCYVVSILRIDYTDESNKMFYLAPLKTLVEEVLTEEYFENGIEEILWKFKCFQYLGNLVVLVMYEEGMTLNKYVGTLDRLCVMADRLFNIGVTAGIGQPCNKLSQLNHSYKSALDALSYRVIFDNTNVISITDVEPSNYDNDIIKNIDTQEIVKAIKLLKTEEIKKVADSYVESIKAAKLDEPRYHLILMELVTELMKVANAYQLDINEIFAGERDIYYRVLQIDTLEKFKDWLYGVCITLRQGIKKERSDSARIIVEKAINYVLANYQDLELSVDKLCQELNVSPAYFSTIFKKQTGNNFVNFLTDIRIEEAIKLLITTDDKTYVIAEKVGYIEPNYFSYVFRKKCGMSPSKYRQMAGKNEG